MKTAFYRLLTGGHPVNGMQPSDFTDPATFTTDDKTETNHTFFQTDDESILTGVWESAPCKEEIESYAVHESRAPFWRSAFWRGGLSRFLLRASLRFGTLSRQLSIHGGRLTWWNGWFPPDPGGTTHASGFLSQSEFLLFDRFTATLHPILNGVFIPSGQWNLGKGGM